MDLVSRIADLLEEGPLEDPESWYQQKFGKPVNYSDIVESLASTPAERNRLMSRYIEPNEQDIREGRKQPTAAHRAIAKLVRLGADPRNRNHEHRPFDGTGADGRECVSKGH